ncbi:hypothetical protein [Bartonella sp. B41]
MVSFLRSFMIKPIRRYDNLLDRCLIRTIVLSLPMDQKNGVAGFREIMKK